MVLLLHFDTQIADELVVGVRLLEKALGELREPSVLTLEFMILLQDLLLHCLLVIVVYFDLLGLTGREV
jgi:hypothetical protein